jgi:putative ABC transport system substrate-binding protein
VAEVVGKRLELLLELVPTARSIAYLRNPTNPVFAESEGRELQVAARARAVRLLLMNASRPSEFETAQRADALVVSSAVSVLTNPDQIVALAAPHSVPAIYASPQSVAIGGLMGYWTNFLGAWRQAGVYTGRILKGEKPADLPVVQPTEFELTINLKTAKALGLTVPPTLLARAHGVDRISPASVHAPFCNCSQVGVRIPFGGRRQN